MKSRRILLCRPQGGLNDILCQIETACLYAERFDRTVVVDTRHHSTKYFRDEFCKYFVSLQNRLQLEPPMALADLAELDVYPRFLRDELNTYTAKFDRSVGKFIDEATNRPIIFDLNIDYDEELIVHHASGGGDRSMGALARVRIHDSLVDQLVARLRIIGPRYTAIHVRNTDFRTDYRRLLTSVDVDNHLPIFLATDDADVVSHARRLFGDSVLHSFSALPRVTTRPLHHLDDTLPAYQRNCDAILDLLMLALSTNLYAFVLDANEFNVRISGYSALAANLKNSKALLRRLIARTDVILDEILSPDIGPGRAAPRTR